MVWQEPALTYDADLPPDPDAWLASEEADRLAAVEAHHRGLAVHPRSPKPRLHAAIHLVVENQLALGEPPEARRALARLVAAGLPRHEAVHAIGLLVADAASGAMDGRSFDARAYARELDALTAEGWRKLGEGG
jgi:hypothetical protein